MTFLRRSFTALLVSAALSGMASAQEAPATTPEDGAPAAAPAEPAAPAIGSQPAASGTVRSTHGSWSIVCESAPGAPTEQCALLQNVAADDRPEVGLTVIALKTADGNTEILRVLAPLGVLLPNGLGLYVDGQDIGKAQFMRCFEDGCYAEVILDPNLRKTLSEGTSATFIVFQTPEQGIGIPVELEGFGEGFDALP
mgnify:FL=1